MRSDREDFWSEDDFENMVASALIACYESKLRGSKGVPPSDLVREDTIKMIRRIGPYIPGNSRLVELVGEPGYSGPQHFDTNNDVPPKIGCIAMPCSGKSNRREYGGYIQIVTFEQRPSLGKYYVRNGGGLIYQMYRVFMDNNGIHGERSYFTVDKLGNVFACDQEIPDCKRGMPGTKTGYLRKSEIDPGVMRDTAILGSMGMQFVSDRRFVWAITAREGIAIAHLGCMKEEIKSLLYARSLPLTSTGRKRPILHLVEAHKRRMRNGTDIDITSFLRGQQTVEIAGTQFTVRPPKVLIDDVSKNSRRFFSDCDIAEGDAA